ncbi:hypothetical protein [Streptomyces canus]|uniref:hypothetical protein n=1 Tax=Streptomyces canus TaxID=58343 RepID=UPI0003676B46|nr:hypothetical protein [Streptomyces canus]
MTDLRPVHKHVWDGGTVPAWLDLHQYWFDNNQLTVATPDGHAHPQPGWWLIGWTDGTVTVASPWTGAHVYADDGITGRLMRAEAAIAHTRTLHRRNEHTGDCEHCSAGDYPDYSVPHPCPTIRALDEEPTP